MRQANAMERIDALIGRLREQSLAYVQAKRDTQNLDQTQSLEKLQNFEQPQVIEQHKLKQAQGQGLSKGAAQVSNCKSSYKCEKCCDTGWVMKGQQGIYTIVEDCECARIENAKRQWKASGIDVENCTQSFDNFQVCSTDARRAKMAAITYLRNFESIKEKNNISSNSIFFCGQPGSGKTHLSVALGVSLLKKGIKVVYMPYRDAASKIKQNMLNHEEYNRIVSKYKYCDVLLIDDLFKGKVSESDINIAFEIINYRYTKHLPIIVSSEYTVNRLLDFDEAVGSRIIEMCRGYVVEIKRDRCNNFRMRSS